MNGLKAQRTETGQLLFSRDAIVVDASNVAWKGGSAQRGESPRLSNLTRMITTLRETGYSRVVAICNASLRHQIDDKSGLDELIRDKTVLEAPAGADADYFIVRRALSLRAHIVSRDSYGDQPADVQDYIRAARVTYMIYDDTIDLLPDPRTLLAEEDDQSS